MRGLGSGRRGDLVSASRRNDFSFEGEFEAESNETEKFAIARRARQTRETRVLPRLPGSNQCAILPSFSTSAAPFFRSLMTKVLSSPSVDHGPRGTSLKSTNLQSVTSVGCNPR